MITLSHIARAAGALVLAGGLAACVDATMDIEVLTENTARGTMTMAISGEFYEMIQGSDEDDFCDDGELTVTDEAATCVSTKEGDFAELAFEEGEDEVAFSSAGPGLVRVAFPTGTMSDEMSEDASDPETLAMMQSFFEGHFLTLRVGGGEITESNMTIADDKQSAELVISFVDMITGKVELPEEAYAIVKVD